MNDEKLKTLINAEIKRGIKIKRDGSIIENAKLIKFSILSARICNNPDYNCTFTGNADISLTIQTEFGEDRMEYPNCQFEGDALFDDKSANIINGLSIIRGLPHNLIK